MLTTMLIPSLTLGQATQWRKGYSEDSSVDGAQSVEDYLATVLTTRLQLATQLHRTTEAGKVRTATFRGGMDAQKDVSQDVELSMEGQSFSVAAADNTTQVSGFVGTSFTFAHSDTLALTLDGELTFTGHQADDLGGTVNAGIRARF